tara:strand:- start:2963 stop:3844 length:882 start_codon:yes stop_codon:yes gene_type:complete
MAEPHVTRIQAGGKKPSAPPPAAAPEEPAVEQARAEAPTPSPLGYTDITLPSRGAFYGPNSVVPTPALPGGVVAIRQMRVAEEEHLATAGGDVIAKIAKIIEAVTRLPAGFRPDQLLVTDRLFIMIALRRITFGPNYPVTFRCDECGANNREVIDVVQELNEKAAADDASEPVLVDLPDAGKRIGLRFFRGFDELEAARDARRAEARGQPQTPVSARLMRQIVEIDGDDSINAFAKKDLVAQMTAADSARVRKTMLDAETGIDLTLYQPCAKCGAVNEFDMPFTAEFFRPTDL